MRPARRPPPGRTRRARLVADAALAVATRSDCNARLPLTHELALGVGVEKRGATGRSGNVRYWEIPFYTCGDPVCGGHTPHPGVPPCSAGEVAGAACSPEGATCDPGDACNRLLLCTTSDPTHGGMCPISRRAYKENVQYLSEADVQRLHDELMSFRLATYRYKAAPSECHLGFIIDDIEPSAAIDPGRDMVDLYGYISMAVAALQTQAREIETLKKEVAGLRRALHAKDGAGRSTGSG